MVMLLGLTALILAAPEAAKAQTDSVAPEHQSAVKFYDTFTVTYSEALDETSVPDPISFHVTRNTENPVHPTHVEVSANTVLLTVSQAFRKEDEIRLTYLVPATNPIQDLAGNAAAEFRGFQVRDETHTVPEVSVEAIHATATPRLANPEFRVRFSRRVEVDLAVTLTFEQSEDYLSETTHTLTMPANETVMTRKFVIAGTASGQLTASVAEGPRYTVREGPSAQVDIVTAQPTIIGAWEQNVYTVSEGQSVEVRGMVRTAQGIPLPREPYQVSLTTEDNSATRADDYQQLNTRVTIRPRDWRRDGATFTSEVARTLHTKEDVDVEETKDFHVWLGGSDQAVPFGVTCRPDRQGGTPGNQTCRTTVNIVDNDTLMLERVAVSSRPTGNGVYHLGENIQLEVTFNGTVSVTGSPRFEFTVGATKRKASYTSGSGTKALVFAYTVQAGETDANGISWAANAIRLNGGTIRWMTSDPNIVVDAPLAHAAQRSLFGHRVDGVAPKLTAITLQGTTLRLAYDEALHEGSMPGPGAYTLQNSTPTVAAVTVNRRIVQLTLSAPRTDSGTLRVSYEVPTENPLRDLAGNSAAAFTGKPVSTLELRLQDGETDNEGRLEVRHDGGQWGTICDDYWTDADADVACRILGHTEGAVDNGGRFLKAHFGQGTGNILLDDVRCAGYETNLLECRYRNDTVGSHNCTHREDVGVRCKTYTVPRVESIEVSAPSGGTYDAGETLEVTLVWSEAVVVTTPTGQLKPSLWVGYKDYPAEHRVEYASGSGTTRTVFAHTVPSVSLSSGSVSSHGSVLVFHNTLRLRDGAIVSKADEGIAAELAHGGYKTAPAQLAAPVIVGAPVLSEAGADGAWTPGDTVQVRLTFGREVEVDTAGGTPSIGLLLGTVQARRAPYASGSGTVELVFEYTLSEADGSHSALLVPQDSLALNGGTIRADGLDVVLAHDGAGKVAVPVPAAALDGANDEGNGPAARFEALPEANDGTTPFTFELHFSEAPDALGSATVGGGLLEVSGARVTGAQRLTQGSNPGWAVNAEPTHGGDISIVLPIRACDEPNAVCFAGQPLSQGLAALVPGTPFTASFSQVPDEHDGEKSFFVHLRLSLEVSGLSYKTVRDALFEVTGGRVDGARRLKPPSNMGWAVRVVPSGLGDVMVTVKETTACNVPPGVCSAHVMLPGGLRTIVKGPATLSVADAEVEEGPDATLEFTVSLSRGRFGETTVDYATSDGTGAKGAAAGSDYTATSGTLTFGVLETSKTISVAVLDDAHDEGSETLTLTLSNPSENVRIADASATGTISNDDPMLGAWLARFGRTVAEQVLDAVEGRLAAARTPGVEMTLAGQALPSGRVGGSGAAAGGTAGAQDRVVALSRWLRGGRGGGEDAGPRWRALTERDLLTGTSFGLTGEAAGGAGGLVSLWGRGALTRFDGRAGDLALDGEVGSLMLGADWTREVWTAGLLLSHARGEGGYRGADEGTVWSTLTGLYPYGRYRVNPRLDVWGVAGYGAGRLTLTPEGDKQMTADMDLRMGAVGLRGVAVQAPTGGGVELAVTSDAMAVRTSSAAVPGLASATAGVTRVRVGLEGIRRGIGLGGGEFAPRAEIGLRHDGGDAETGFGADIGGGFSWSHAKSGVTAEMSARGLLTHEAGGFRDKGIAGSLSWDPEPSSGRGPKLTIRQTLGGAPRHGVDALLGRETLAGLAADHNGVDELQRRRLESRFGYGFPAFGDRFTSTPEFGFGLSKAGRDYSLGWRLTHAGPGSLELSIDATRRESANDHTPPEHGIVFQVAARW